MGHPLYMGVWYLIFTLQPGKATADDKDAIPSNQIVYMLDTLRYNLPGYTGLKIVAQISYC